MILQEGQAAELKVKKAKKLGKFLSTEMLKPYT